MSKTRKHLACMISSRFTQAPCNEIIVFCYMQAVERHFSRFAKQDISLKIEFEKSEITLNIPEDGILQDGWKITPMTNPVVSLYCIQVK